MREDMVRRFAELMVVGDRPRGYEGASIEEVQSLYAESWVRQGFTDATEVAGWIGAGVHDAGTAADAIELGHRPGDPWVPKRPPAYVATARTLHRPGRWKTLQNRRAARKAWERAQAAETAARGALERDVRAIQATDAAHLAVLDLKQGRNCTETEVTDALADLIIQTSTAATTVDAAAIRYWRTMSNLIATAAESCSPQTRAHVHATLLGVNERLNSLGGDPRRPSP